MDREHIEQWCEFGTPSTEELPDLARHMLPATYFPRNSVIRAQGEPPEFLYQLVEGWAAASVTLPGGERQLMTIHLPGELMGVPSVCLREAAETLSSLTPVTVRRLPVTRFAQLLREHRGFAVHMFLASQRARIALMDRVTAMGAKRALGRLSAMLLELHERLGEAGLARNNEFQLRMTQDEIGDYLGLTAVHVNRTFRQLEQRGLIARRLQRIALVDLPALREVSGFVSRLGPSRAPNGSATSDRWTEHAAGGLA